MTNWLNQRSLLITLILFLGYLAVIWVPFLSYFSKESLQTVPEDFPKSQYSEAELDEILSIATWSPALDYYRIASLPDFKRALSVGISDKNSIIQVSPFSESHLRVGDSSWQLSIHSLMLVKAHINAYVVSGNQQYIKEAVNYLRNYIQFEENNPFDEGFLFNDHAVAARVYAVSLLWRYVQYADINTSDKQLIHSYVYELCSRLLNSRFYNHKTNHGTMQNVALMLASTVFDYLPKAPEWGQTGKKRLEEQIRYLVSGEGFFLEHSFGYQEFMISLVKAADIYAKYNTALSSQLVSDTLTKMESLLTKMVRPDGTLATMGDTSGGKAVQSPIHIATEHDPDLFPASGILLSNGSFQDSTCIDQGNSYFLTLFWSNFANHGHKRWDDMSTDLWACGTQWWRNIGYVPYWHPSRIESETWFGSNAPHIISETAPKPNSASLRQYGSSKQISFFQMERETGSASVFRDILRIDNLFLVRDYMLPNDLDSGLETIWSFDNKLRNLAEGSGYNLLIDNKNQKLTTQFFYGDRGAIKRYYGHRNSPLGWTETLKEMKPSATYTIKSIGQNPEIAKLSKMLAANQSPCKMNYHSKSSGVDHVEIKIDGCQKAFTIIRQNGNLSVNDGEKTEVLRLITPNREYEKEIDNINLHTQSIFDHYGQVFRTLKKYRIKVSYFGGAIFAAIVFIALIFRHYISGVKRSIFNLMNISLWVVLIIWVKFIYFG